MHGSVEDTKLSTNKQHSLSFAEKKRVGESVNRRIIISFNTYPRLELERTRDYRAGSIL